MKKEYIQPSMNIVKVLTTNLLAGSNLLNYGFGGGSGDGDGASVSSRDNGFFDDDY